MQAFDLGINAVARGWSDGVQDKAQAGAGTGVYWL